MAETNEEKHVDPTQLQGKAQKLLTMGDLHPKAGVIQLAKESLIKSGLYEAIGAITGRAIPLVIIQQARHADLICHCPWFRELKEHEVIPVYAANLKEVNRVLGHPVYEVEFVETDQVSPYRYTAVRYE